MSMGDREGSEQEEFWMPTQNLAQAPGHPFYRKLNEILKKGGFNSFVRERCKKFYSREGRPSVPPETYFRMLLVGFFEGIDSERGIEWRCADSLSLRSFLGVGLDERVADHSTLSVIRHRIDLETHQEVFTWVLKVVAREGLLKGKTVGVDSTTLEANAALKSIVRKDTEESYEEFLTGLAKASGIKTPTREDLAKLDRKRPKKGSNDDWTHPHDPDAKITKMKDGRTHLAHKDEHAVDLDSGAVLAVTVRGAHLGDTQTLKRTLKEAQRNLREVARDVEVRRSLPEKKRPREWIEEVVADKGYHSNGTLVETHERTVRTYFSEPKRGRRDWSKQPRAQSTVYANRRRIRSARGKRLMRKRGELIERAFANYLDQGRMRRTHLRGHENILKRLLIHVAGFNLSLVMRKLIGCGTPKGLQDVASSAFAAIFVLLCVMKSGVQKSRQHSTCIPDSICRNRLVYAAA